MFRRSLPSPPSPNIPPAGARMEPCRYGPQKGGKVAGKREVVLIVWDPLEGFFCFFCFFLENEFSKQQVLVWMGSLKWSFSFQLNIVDLFVFFLI